MKFFAAALLGACLAMPATAATVVYSNDFDGENGGAVSLNYTGFTGLTVTDGTVDLVGPALGITCNSGSLCVDLDGSTANSGILASTSSFAFAADQTVLLRFILGGNQRGGIDDTVAALRLGSAQFLTSTGYSHNGSVSLFGSTTTDTLTLPIGTADVASFGTFTLFFTSSQAGEVRFDFSTTSNDNVGAILDDVSLSIGDAIPSVPEPASWAMMIAGFGLVGNAMRRRTRSTATYA